MDQITPEQVGLGAGVAALLVSLSILWNRLRVGHWVCVAWRSTFGRSSARIFSKLDDLQDQLGEVFDQIRPNGHGSVQEILVHMMEQQSESYALNHAMLHADNRAVFLADSDGQITMTNRAHSYLTGFRADQLEGIGWINVIHPDDRKALMSKWRAAVDGKYGLNEPMVRYVTPNGRTYHISVDVFKQLDPKGGLRGYLGLVELIPGELGSQGGIARAA